MPELTPLQLLLATFAGWVHRQQAQVVDYLIEENRVLRQQLGNKRLRLTNDQRRRLAAKGKIRPNVIGSRSSRSVMRSNGVSRALHARPQAGEPIRSGGRIC